MSDSYHQLLDAAVQHLQALKAEGQRYVSVAPETLKALAGPAPRGVKTSAPVAAPAHTVGPAASAAPHPSATFSPAPKLATAPAPAPRSATPVPAPAPVRTEAFVAPAAEKIIPVSAAQPLSREEKEKAMADLRERAMGCVKCPHLAASRKNVVFGVGDIHSPLMFVGEAPGADEDVQGEPFVGAAGQLLTKIIQTMGLSRNTVYIANILKCRPDTPGQAFGNRKPTPEEMATCSPYLLAQIDLIQPKAIVALGATAVEGLLGKTLGITKLRGTWQEFRGVPVMPTYHPSYLLRTQSLLDKRKVWEDMMAAMEKLGMPISEKQRGFFLKG